MRRSLARTTVLLLLPFLASVFAACHTATEPLPEGTHPLSAPGVYQAWWSMVESCSGQSATFSAIHFYVVPKVAQFERNGLLVSGYWSSDDNRIVVAEQAMLDGGLVRHEMLHAMLGHGRHTREAFLERCGGTVVCLSGCLEDLDAAPRIAASVARVPAEDMLVDVSVEPLVPLRTIMDGHFHLTVRVTNPRSDSIVVLLPSSGDVPPASFSFLLSSGRTGLWFTEHAWDSGILVFAPHATRLAVFDFVLADRFDGIRALPEGTYAVQGGFGPALSQRRSFVFGRSE